MLVSWLLLIQALFINLFSLFYYFGQDTLQIKLYIKKPLYIIPVTIFIFIFKKTEMNLYSFFTKK